METSQPLAAVRRRRGGRRRRITHDLDAIERVLFVADDPASAQGARTATGGRRAWSWGLSPLEDQQLGGLIMWVPGCAAFLASGTPSAPGCNA
jgi:hypothetical protein